MSDHPLSAGQKALWFLGRLAPESAAYNLAIALRIPLRVRSPLDTEALARSLAALSGRHPALRTTFPTVDGEPRQRVHPRLDPEFTVRAVDDLETPLAEEAQRPFDLEAGPLFRCAVLRTEADQALLLVLHHAVADFWSLTVLVGELGALYAQETGGPAAALPPLPLTYVEWTERQEQRLAADGESLWTWWRDRLKDAPQELALPTDKPRPPVQAFRGASRELRLDEDLTAAIRALARQRGATLFTALATAFQALLARAAEQTDLLLGVPTSGRTGADAPELAQLVGYVANPVVLRADLSGHPGFAMSLRRTRRALSEAVEHPFPFLHLVERLQPRRDAGRSPLVQAMLVLERAPRPEEQALAACLAGAAGAPLLLGGLGCESLPIRESAAQFDLRLTVAELEGRLLTSLQFDTGLFHPTTAERLLAHFRALLAEAVADPERPLATLPLLSEAERHQVTVEWNDTGTSASDLCLHEMVFAQARRTPDAVAVIGEDRTLTYRDLETEALQLADRLRRLGFGLETRVGLSMERGAGMIVGVLGILASGGAYVPLDPAYPEERLAWIKEDAGVGVVVAGGPHPRPLSHLPPTPPPGEGRQETTPGSLAYLIYTSGSTGRPKGVAIEHRSAVARIRWALRAFSREELAGVLASTSLAFDLSVFEIFAPLSAGGTVIVASDALHLARHPAAGRVTLLNTVPSALAELIRLGAVPPSVRTVNLAGEPLPGPLADAVHALGTVERLWNLYGPSEDTTYSTGAVILSGDARPAIGRPLDGSTALVLDPWLQPVASGGAGEICLAGAGLARGYFGRPDLTAERFVPHPLASAPGERLYRTGDRGRLRPDGALEFLGRRDHQVKIRGFRIEPGEIEAALLRYPGVREAVVIPREDIPGHARLAAYVVGQPLPEELRDALRRTLPEHMVPAVFVHLDALPRTANGKVDRKALPHPEIPAETDGHAPPRNRTEEVLARLWQRVLRLDRAGIHDDFFALGGDSILGIQIVALAAQEGIRLAPRDFFRCRTIARLAEDTAAAETASPLASAEQGEVTGPVPLTPIQRWFLDREPAEPWHFNQAVLLELARPLDPARLERALTALLRHHDALRLRFHRDGAEWRQVCTPFDAAEPVPFTRLDLSVSPAALSAAVAQIQASLDLTAGPLLRAVWIDRGAGCPAWLLLVIHHLAVDGVSWRILLEDLESAILGRALPAKTGSYKEWAEASHPPRSFRLVPRPQDDRRNTQASARTLSVSLSAEETWRLLREAPQALGTQINGVLLMALEQAWRSWCGEALRVDVEGHGRDTAPGMDLSRTVGWFTSIERRGTEGEGLLFNYLGQLDAWLEGSSLFRSARGPLGPLQSRRGLRSHALEINGWVLHGRLRTAWTYSTNLHCKAEIAALARGFMRELRRLIGDAASDRSDRSVGSVESVDPLTPVQHGILLHSLLAPGLYGQQLDWTLRGPLDPAALRRAWERLMERHTVLRTSFSWEGLERPLQTVHRKAALPWSEHDWRHLSPAAVETELHRFLAEDRAQGFDLGRAPLMRLALIRTGEETHRLLWSHHHILLDGWSIQLLQSEWLAAYRGESLPERPRPFREYVEWLHRTPREPEAEAFWRSELAGLSEPTPLPLAKAAGSSADRAERSLRLSAQATAVLQAFARAHRLTLNTLVQGAWARVLAGTTGQDDVLFGTTSSGRDPDLPGIERMAGLFIHTLPARVRIEEREPLVLWLQRLQDHQAEMRRFERCPLPPEAPPFEALLVLESYPTAPEVTDLRFHERNHYPLTLVVVPGRELRIDATYDPARLEAASVDRLLGHFTNALRFEEGLLDDAERHQLLVEWNDTHRELPDATLHGLIAAQAARTPGAVALVFEGTALNYGELDRQSDALAHRLRALGAGPDARVGLCAERSLELVVALLGILKAGAAYIPLDPGDPPQRLALILEDAQPQVVLAQKRCAGALPLGTGIVFLDGHPEARNELKDLGGRTFPPPRSFRLGTRPQDDLDGDADGDHLAYVIFTSGSTGRPKGAMNTHRAIVNRLLWMQEAYRLTPGDAVLQKTPASFDVSVWEFFWPLMTGARLVLARPGGHRDPEYLARCIQDSGITTVHFVPTLLRAFLDHPAAARCRGLRRILCSGEALPCDLKTRCLDLLPAELHNLYGPTEAAVDVTAWDCRQSLPEPVVPIGRPIHNTALHILDPWMGPAPIGVPGELCIGGVGLARGYLHRPDLTAERFIPDPFGEAGARLYRTGDRARRRPDGAIEYLGRLDHQVKIRGVRIEPGEVEAALRRHPDIREAVVIAHEGRLVAYVVGDGVPTGDLARFCRSRLPEAYVPSRFVLLDRLPLTPSGKIDRRALPAPDGARPETETAYTAPRTAVEETLARLWARVLRLDRVGVRDSFFELGGDSILGLQVVALAAQEGLRLTPGDFFRHKTIERLAAVARPAGAVQAEQGPVTGPLPLTPIQHWFLEREPAEPWHFNQSVLLELRRPVALPVLSRAVDALLRHHDALRLRCERTPAGWVQRLADPGESAPVLRIDLSGLSNPEQALEEAAATLQESLDLAAGPLLRAACFAMRSDRSDRSDRLLLVIHHFAVDAVSWRILLADLETACGQIAAGRPVALPAKTTSVRTWAERLAAHAASEEVRRELPAWRIPADKAAPLPLDFARGANTCASAATVSMALDTERTETLLRRLPALSHTAVDEEILAALAPVLARWTGRSSLLVEIEAHGREEIVDGLDLSRTVGWFTSAFPVCCPVPPSPGRGARGVRALTYGLLRYLGTDEIRQELRAHPAPQVRFNYLGQLDAWLAGSDLFAPASEASGPPQSRRGLRSTVLEIDAWIAAGRLQVSWTYSRNLHRPDTIERLAQELRRALEARIDACGEREDSYPLSPLQEGLLFHTVCTPGSSPFYHQQLWWTLRADLDPAAFRQAWQRLVDHHAALRTAFAWEGRERPVQTVLRRVEVPWSEMDWRPLSEAEREARFAALLAEDRRQGFDPAHAPLLRLTLVRWSDGSWRFLWSHHHLLLDGWSVQVLQSELLALYRGEVLPPARPYRDFIAWLAQQDEAEAEAYWRGALTGLAEPTPLPWDRGGEPGPDRAERSLSLSAAATADLQAFARRSDLTLSTVMQGVWALLLARSTGTSDILFGATTAGRPASLPGAGSMVGLFINTLPVRVRIEDRGESAVDWLRRLQEEQAEARRFEHTPLVRMPRHAFETLLVFESYPVTAGLQEGLGTGEEPRFAEATHYPLTLIAVPGRELRVTASYDPARLERTAVDRLLGGFLTLLSGLAQETLNPTTHEPWVATPLHRRGHGVEGLLNEAGRHQVLVEWNDTHRELPDGTTLHGLIAAQAGRTPDAVALVFEGTSLTYRELDRQSDDLALYLRDLGAGPDARVGLCAERSLELVIALLGVLKAGAAYIPLDPGDPPQRLALILEDAEPQVVLAQKRCAGALPLGTGIVFLDQDANADGVFRGAVGPKARASLAQGNALGGEGGDHLAYVIFTSGSTGRPKGAMNTHRAIVNRLLWMQEAYRLTPDDAVLQKTPASFDVSVWEFFWPLMTGARLVLARPGGHRDPEYLARCIQDNAVTTVHFVPTLLRAFLDHPAAARCRGLRRILCSGEALPCDLRTRCLDLLPAELHNLYGPTEAAVDVTAWDCRQSLPEPVVPIGRPIHNTALHILDPWMAPAPIGVPGELCIGGVGLARGYLHRPGLTAERFIPDPFGEAGARLYRTGDRARRRPDGAIEYLGRLDHQVKIRGVRIEPGEVEAALRRHPGVREAVVIACEGRLIAYVVGNGGPACDLTCFCRSQLPEAYVPARFVFLDRLPLTPSGKVDRRVLPTPGDDRPETAQPYAAPSTAVERALAAIWRESLGLAEVGLFDSFFDLGGHSLLLFKVRGLVKERLGRDLPALDFFRHPTLAALARSLDGPEDAQGSLAPDDRGAARRAGRGALDRQRSSRRSHRPTTDPADQEIPA